jgi:pimeloyl-ACP methyl ester carboxylesterase
MSRNRGGPGFHGNSGIFGLVFKLHTANQFRGVYTLRMQIGFLSFQVETQLPALRIKNISNGYTGSFREGRNSRYMDMAGLPEEGLKTVEVNGITLAYREIGSGNPLLMINGFASTMDTWNPPVLATLAAHFRVIIFDNRGTGYSSSTDEPFSIALFADDTRALMEALHISRAHVLGLSMGASVAQELVLAKPELVNRLIFVAGTFGGDKAEPMQQETWERLADKSGTPDDLANRMFSLLFPGDWLATHDPWQYCPEVHETTSIECAGRQAEAFTGWPGSYDRLPGIRCPVLVITGTEDIIIPAKNAGLVAGRIPGARCIRIPGAGHGLQYQCHEDLGREIIRFLTETR